MLPRPRTAEPSVTTATVLPLIGQPPDVLGVLGDRHAHPADAGGVGHRQVVAVAQRHLRGDLDLAAEVEQEGPVADLVTSTPVDARRPRPRASFGVVGVAGRAGDVDDEPLVAGLGHVDRRHDAAGAGRSPSPPRPRPRGPARCSRRIVIEYDEVVAAMPAPCPAPWLRASRGALVTGVAKRAAGAGGGADRHGVLVARPARRRPGARRCRARRRGRRSTHGPTGS